MSSLNCPEEVFLAEKLTEMHPWSDMVKFAELVERQILLQ